jgi:dTDP-4-dehydrorhamnose 3,5-epimerase
MKFVELAVPGAFEVSIEPHTDDRGFFARTWCQQEFEAAGLANTVVQASISFNKRSGTLRGLHFQKAPSHEARLLRFTTGAAFAVVLDLRPNSGSYLRHVSCILDSERHNAVYVPPGCALGFQTLAGESTGFYQMTDFYRPDLACGFRWNDPAFGIGWPDAERTILSRDADYPDFDPSLVQDFVGYAQN